MRLPRDLSGRDLAQALRTYGYRVTRQTGSHMQLTTQEGGEHRVTVPAHSSLRVGTLASVVQSVAKHFGVEKEEIERRLFTS